MGRKKHVIPSERVRLDKRVQMPITDPREQVAYDWVQTHKKNRKAGTMAWELLISALNGEIGGDVQVAVESGDTDMAKDAMQDILSQWE